MIQKTPAGSDGAVPAIGFECPPEWHSFFNAASQPVVGDTLLRTNPLEQPLSHLNFNVFCSDSC
jgi:hypothetical protein